MQNRTVIFQDLGKIRYQEAWDRQTVLFDEVVRLKMANRKLPEDAHLATPNYLLFCEHFPVYTLGKSGASANLLLDRERLDAEGIGFYHINRGGDITYHGPGQVTGYPIFDMHNFYTDIGKYLRDLEEVMIRTIAEFGISGSRIEGLTGVWLDAGDPLRARKIGALGVHASRWVTMHGFSLNVSTDLSYFDFIVPCGIRDKGVTSIEKETGARVDMEHVKQLLRENFADVFGFSYAMPA